MSWVRTYGALVGRILIAAIFLISGVGKLIDPSQASAMLASRGFPGHGIAWSSAIAAGLVEVVAGFMVLSGWKGRWAALVLFAYLIPTTALFHNPIGLAGAERQDQAMHLLKNLAIMGGLLLLAASGPGKLSVDGEPGWRWLRPPT